MILGANKTFEINKQYSGVYYKDDARPMADIQFVVLRKASREEWEEYRKSMGLTTNMRLADTANFYLVSTD